MKNPIIAELRKIRDAHAAAHNFNLDSIARELTDLEPWMREKTYTLQDGKFVKVSALKKEKKK
jgi:hypothetical protein